MITYLTVSRKICIVMVLVNDECKMLLGNPYERNLTVDRMSVKCEQNVRKS